MTTSVITPPDTPAVCSGFIPTAELTWDSASLGRRIMLCKVELLTTPDLRILRLEARDAIESIRAILKDVAAGDVESPGTEKLARIRAKSRIAGLFDLQARSIIAARREEAKLEQVRTKRDKQIAANDRSRRRSKQINRALFGMLREEIGAERLQTLQNRATEIAEAELEAEEIEQKE